MKSFLVLTLAGLLIAPPAACAQDFAIDSFTLDSGGGTSSGGGFEMNGIITQPEPDAMSGGGFSVAGEFLSLVAAVPSPTPVTSVTIFDNTAGEESGGFGATTNIWLAGKICLGSQAYRLDSLSTLLSSGNFSGNAQPPSTVRLRLYSHDPVSGRPAVDTGLIMNLYGRTNPIVLQPFDLTRWTPAAPFTLTADTCYWVVLSVDAGAVAGWIHSGVPPVGAAGTFGFTRSIDSGATWATPDNTANYKMLIQGVAVTSANAPLLSIAGQVADVRIFWPLSATGFVLDQSPTITGVWSQVAFPYSTNEIDISVNEAPPTGNKFYRLRLP